MAYKNREVDPVEANRLHDLGWRHQEIADYLGVGRTAVTKSLLRNKPEIALSKLTPERQIYVKLRSQGANPGDAAQTAFNEEDRAKALQRAHNAEANPAVKSLIVHAMEKSGITREYRANKLKKHIDSDTEKISLEALKEANKLADDYPVKKTQNLSLKADITPVDLERYRTVKLMEATDTDG